MVENFIDRMERYLGIRKRIIDLDDAWKRYSGSSEPLSESMRNVSALLHLIGFEEATRDFIDEYRTRTGRGPYLDRVNTAKMYALGQFDGRKISTPSSANKCQ
ncbi:MAG: hypothetical protein M1813_000460 [Trichoglossum hirsutum]|nr:MAG: hypothetical protein M1813_000460 [Trichoglossum hirsutum]